jgi:hypothetical protein
MVLHFLDREVLDLFSTGCLFPRYYFRPSLRTNLLQEGAAPPFSPATQVAPLDFFMSFPLWLRIKAAEFNTLWTAKPYSWI